MEKKTRDPPPLVLLIIIVFSVIGLVSTGITILLSLPWFITFYPPLDSIVGIALLGIGFPMMFLTLKELRVHRALGSEIFQTESKSRLITTGIYARTRNPLYLTSTILFLGWAFLLRLTTIYFMTLFFIILFIRVAKWEEKELEDRFGEDYVIYRDSVPFFIPYPSSNNHRPSL